MNNDCCKVLQHGEFNNHGWRRADLKALVLMTASALSRQLARLKSIGLIKKVAHAYRYYLTRLGVLLSLLPAQLPASTSSRPWLKPYEVFAENAKTELVRDYSPRP